MAIPPKRRSLDVISLCTGGGGLDLGLELAIPGARPVAMVEREAFAVAHLVAAMQAGLMAECPLWDDARTFDGKPWRGLVDGVIGGIPCQPHSLAGRKQGQRDERDLWSDARRIVVQSRAWFVLIENVGGMLSAGADEIAGAERVWRDLQRLGFTVEGGLFRASEVGAPHERERVFILGLADAIGDADGGQHGPGRFRSATGEVEGKTQGQDWQRRGARSGDDCQDVADARGSRREGRERGGASEQWDGTASPRSTAELRGASLVNAAGVGRGEGRSEPDIRRGRRAADGAVDEMVDAVRSRHDGWADVSERRPQWRAVGKGAGVGLFPPGPGDSDGWRAVLERAPELEPAVRRMVDGLAGGLDDDGRFAVRTDRLRMLGNGVVPLQAGYAIRTLIHRLAERGSARAGELVRMMETAA